MSWFCNSKIPGCDAWWHSKTEGVHSWIDYHISEAHGPPTHFITCSCAEFWWTDLQRIIADMERLSRNAEEVKRIKNNNIGAVS